VECSSEGGRATEWSKSLGERSGIARIQLISMPLNLGRTGNAFVESVSKRKVQDWLRLVSHSEDGGHRCLSVRKGSKSKNEDVCRKLTADIELLVSESCDHRKRADRKAEQQHQKVQKELCSDVQKQVHCIIDLLKELTDSEGAKPHCGKDMEEKIEMLEELIAADLPVQLLSQLCTLEFEARKDVMNLCSALLWPGLPKEIEKHVLEYLRYHPRICPVLVAGYSNEEAALHCGVVLRSCMRHVELVEAFLESGQIFELIRFARHPNIDISSDAFYSLREVLMEHKEVSGPWLADRFDEFFALFNPLLQCEDYVVERQAVTLLGSMLLDRHFQRVMRAYAGNELHLQIVMNLLRDTSSTIQAEAFHVFKIFVMNPQKPPRVQQILVKNKDKLVELLQTLHAVRTDDVKFNEDQKTVIGRLMPMTMPPRKVNTASDMLRVSSTLSVATTCSASEVSIHGLETLCRGSAGTASAVALPPSKLSF